ncbi:GIY-YIG nuclease family protein [Streptomyces fungicidicus]|uniref:GIY-YIG nuclease family protein n=1 Tax=Streptomyces fungicidicus TaxID=68203 RepID=UPI003D71E378
MSPKYKIKVPSKREYSTSSGRKTVPKMDNNSSSLDGIHNNEPIKFNSIEQGCKEIKFKYIGVSGVYKLTNKNNTDRFYIGSSNNLARRMEEYLNLTKGLRNPQSSGELEISLTPASD